MKTAIQEHIEWLKNTLEICEENAPKLVNFINLCITNAKSKLEIEEDQIIESYKSGFLACCFDTKKNPEQYYNETFKSE